MGHPNTLNNDLAYLESVHLTADESTPNLIEMLKRLYEIILQTPRHSTSAQWNQALYAASLLSTTDELLQARLIKPNDYLFSDTSIAQVAEILRHPIEWTSIQILLSRNGEKHLPQIIRVYDQMQLIDKKSLLKRLMATLGKRELINDIGRGNVELRQRIEARQLLEQIRDGATDTDKQAMIDNFVWFGQVELTMCHLLHVFLVDQEDRDFYHTSCLVYGAFLDAMQVKEYANVFWDRLLLCVDGKEEGEMLFRRCCNLSNFFDSVVDQIREFLQSIRPLEINGEFEWVGASFEFSRVRRIVCILLDQDSLVKTRFADQLDKMDLDVRLRSELFQFVIYD